MNITILFFGDVVGKLARRALKENLSDIKRKFSPDFLFANVENLSHGNGVSLSTMKELDVLGFDGYTSGNHVFNKKKDIDEIFAKYPIVRPANYPKNVPGSGMTVIKKQGISILLANVSAQAFFRENFNNTYESLDEIVAEKGSNLLIVDIHSETTSETRAAGFYLDGKSSLVVGTHTHVPTADAQILPKGTGYITDVGMVGPLHSVLGLEKEEVIKTFQTQIKHKADIIEKGTVEINFIVANLNTEDRKCKKIELVRKIV